MENVIVKREYKNIDILLDIKIAGKSYLFVIENKVDANEQFYEDKEVKGQLEKYQEITSDEYKNHQRIYLFLSPDRRQASSELWTAIDYKLIYAALSMVKTDSADDIIKTLVIDYKKLIKRQFKMGIDKKMKEAVLKIYKDNADVFDFIFENLPKPVNEMANIIREYLQALEWI